MLRENEPHIKCLTETKLTPRLSNDILNLEEYNIWRRDKRTALQMRPLKCDCSVLARSDGSARFCIGSTTVLASVYGPADVDQRRGSPPWR